MGCTTSKESDEPYDSRKAAKPLETTFVNQEDSSTKECTAVENGQGEREPLLTITEDSENQQSPEQIKDDAQFTDYVEKKAALADAEDDNLLSNSEMDITTTDETTSPNNLVLEEEIIMPVQAQRVKEMPAFVLDNFLPCEDDENVHGREMTPKPEPEREVTPTPERPDAAVSDADTETPTSAGDTKTTILSEGTHIATGEGTTTTAQADQNQYQLSLATNEVDEMSPVKQLKDEETITVAHVRREKIFSPIVEEHFTRHDDQLPVAWWKKYDYSRETTPEVTDEERKMIHANLAGDTLHVTEPDTDGQHITREEICTTYQSPNTTQPGTDQFSREVEPEHAVSDNGCYCEQLDTKYVNELSNENQGERFGDKANVPHTITENEKHISSFSKMHFDVDAADNGENLNNNSIGVTDAKLSQDHYAADVFNSDVIFGNDRTDVIYADR